MDFRTTEPVRFMQVWNLIRTGKIHDLDAVERQIFDDMAVVALFAQFEGALVRDFDKRAATIGKRPMTADANLVKKFRATQSERNVLADSYRENVVLRLDAYEFAFPFEIVHQSRQEIREVLALRNWAAHGKLAFERPNRLNANDAHDRIKRWFIHIPGFPRHPIDRFPDPMPG